MVQYIDNVKKILVERVDQNPDAVSNHWYISYMSEPNISSYYLGEGSEMGQELYTNLYTFKQELKGELQRMKVYGQLIDKITNGIKTEVRG